MRSAHAAQNRPQAALHGASDEFLILNHRRTLQLLSGNHKEQSNKDPTTRYLARNALSVPRSAQAMSHHALQAS